MAQRYRDFKRVCFSAKVGKKMEKLLVDATLEDHYKIVECLYCKHRGRRFDCEVCGGKGKHQACDKRCWHEHSLPVARLLASKLTVGVKRARLDIPDDPPLAKLLAKVIWDCIVASDTNNLREGRLSGVQRREFKKTATVAEKWAARSPLERLAEAGLELD